METFEDHYASMHKALMKHMPNADMELIDQAVEYANAKHKYLVLELTPGTTKADLNESQTMQRLLRAKES